jgi:phosphoribosylaminoimidazole carboxylase (NCAIR synthetase)
VVTLEWENADVATLRELEALVPVRPGPAVLEVRSTACAKGDGAAASASHRGATARSARLDELTGGASGDRAPAVLKTARGATTARGRS